MRLFSVLALLFLVSSCSLLPSQMLPRRNIEILPIVLGFEPEYALQHEEASVLAVTSFIFRQELNITFSYDQIYYTNDYVPIQQCDLFDGYFIRNIDVSSIIKSEKIVVFIEYANQCQNLLGCGEYQGIILNEKESRLWVYLSGDPFFDSYILVHEIAHILGAAHTDDNTIMSPAASITDDWTFSKESRKQILDTLDKAKL